MAVSGHNENVQRLYLEFGRLLREARSLADLTQQEVGRRVGLTRTSITNIERGSQHISLHQLFLLANAVGRKPTDLLPADGVDLRDLVPPDAFAGLELSEEDEGFAVRVLRNNPRMARAVSGSGKE
jgi:transcriptional regulator with XRE-family HTH domain